jgi:hypothetical protein
LTDDNNEYDEYLVSANEIKKTTYQEALDALQPHGRFLVGLMENISRAKTETVDLQSLRLAREKLDDQIMELTNKRSIIQAEMAKSCLHPLDRFYVEEFQIDSLNLFKVTCGACQRELIKHSRDV